MVPLARMTNVLSDERDSKFWHWGSWAGVAALSSGRPGCGARRPAPTQGRAARRAGPGAVGPPRGNRRRGVHRLGRPSARGLQPGERGVPAGASAGRQRVRAVSRADRGGPRPRPRRHGDLARSRRRSRLPRPVRSVRRFVITLRGQRPAEAHPVIVTAPGEEGRRLRGRPMVRHPDTGKYRRMRLFVFTLGYSRRASGCDLHVKHAALGRAARGDVSAAGRAVTVVVLDNLREGAHAGQYDPTLDPLYRDVLAHYGVVALPCASRIRSQGQGRVGDRPYPGRPQGPALRDARRGAGLPRRSDAARPTPASMARPSARSPPCSPRSGRPCGRCRSSRFATPVRPAHGPSRRLREVEYAYTPRRRAGSAAPSVQWDGVSVRLLHPTTGALLREHRRQAPGRHAIHPADRPSAPRPPRSRCSRRPLAGTHVGALWRPCIARIGGRACAASSGSSPWSGHGAAVVDDACAAALERRSLTTASCGATSSGAPRRPSRCARSIHSSGPHPLPRRDRAKTQEEIPT